MASQTLDIACEEVVDRLFAAVTSMDTIILDRTKQVSIFWHRNKPASLQMLERDIQRFRGTKYDTMHLQQKMDYLLNDAKQISMWEDITYCIVDLANLAERGSASKPSWKIWARKVYKAGEHVVKEASLSSRLIRRVMGIEGADAITARLQQVDVLLAELLGDHGVSLSKQLEENLLAIAEIECRGGSIDPNIIEYFKSEIRARKANIGAAPPLVTNSENVDNAHDTKRQDIPEDDPWRSTIFGSTMVLIIVSFIPVYYGWRASPAGAGSTSDADFWFSLQGTLMQAASIIPLVRSFWKRSERGRQVYTWIWIFISAGIACIILAPTLYLLFSTGWSAVFAFLGSVFLALVILEAMLMPSMTEKKTN